MTDLDQRIAALREAVKTASTTVVIDGHVQYASWTALAVIDEQAAEIERLRMCLYDEQDGITGTLRTDEIERLRARVAELERDPYASKCHNTAMTHYQEVGPTPLRGRVTRRDE